jgi:hypothetical protein
MAAGFGGLAIGEGLDFLRIVRGDERASLRPPVGHPFEIRSGSQLAHAFGRREFTRGVE